MFPILVKIGPVTIHTYGFMMALGVGLGLWFIFIQAKKQGMEASRLIDMAFYTIIIALIGAKAVLLVGDLSYYFKNPSELLSLARSGGVFQGGLAFGFIFAMWYLYKHRIPTWKAADVFAPALALGHAFGRVGCFSAGCCYGHECAVPWGVTFHSEYAHSLTGIPLNTPLHPTQLYEAVLNFINFGILFYILKKKKFDGQVFSFYIINYSVYRFVIEFFRFHPDKAYLFQNPSSLSYSQVFCIFGLIGGIVLFILLKKRKRA